MVTNNEGNEVRTIRKFCPYCKDTHNVIPRGCLLVQRVDNKFTSEYECTNCGRKFRITEERYSK
jgi:transposase-like protein